MDTSNLNVGDVIYSVKEVTNGFGRKKAYRIIDGEKWFKYDRDVFTYEIETITILGVLDKQLSGIWDSDESYDLVKEFYVSSDNANKPYTTDLTCRRYFATREEAEAAMSRMVKKALDIDMENTYQYSNPAPESYFDDIRAARDNMSNPGNNDYDT